MGEQIDDLIVLCNDLPRALMTGQYVEFCSEIVRMVTMLAELKAKVVAENVRDQS